METVPRRTAAYCRVSTLSEDQELSFETQRNYYEQLISRDPAMIPAGIYADQGFSGLHADKRKEFLRLIADCEAGKIDLVLVKSISRFSRSTVDCMETLARLKRHGVTVLFEKEGLSSADPRTGMILSVFASMAQSESCSHSENIRWARRRRDELGDPIRRAPYGYRNVRSGKGRQHAWIPWEPEAARVRRIFRLAWQGYSTREIREAANRTEAAEGTGIAWTADRIRTLLKNEAYRGDILTNKTVTLDYLHPRLVKNPGQAEQYYIEAHHEPLVDPGMFDAVQAYFRCGYLRGSWTQKRTRWLESHPEILQRRENCVD